MNGLEEYLNIRFLKILNFYIYDVVVGLIICQICKYMSITKTNGVDKY